MSFGAGSWDIWLIKIDALGNMQWSKTFGGTDFDWVQGERTITQTSDGGYVIVGYTLSYGTDTLWLIKTDQSGNMQWSRRYGPWWGAKSIVQTSDGGYAIGGSDGDDFLLVKTDSTGNMQWYRTYGGPNYDLAHSLVQTVDGGYALAGETRSFGAGDYDVWLVKTDANGNIEWSRTFGGSAIDDGMSVIQTADGGYAIACRQYSFGAGLSDFWLIKTDASGNVEWNFIYGGPDYDTLHSVVQTVDGGFALAGDTKSFATAGDADFWLIKLAGPTSKIVEARVDIDPDTLNLKSEGRWITAYIELPEGYDVSDINVSSILLNDTISIDPFWTDKPLESVIGDYDNDTIPDLMVCFNWTDVTNYILSKSIAFGNVTLEVSGKLYNDTAFTGTDPVQVSSLLGDINVDGKVDMKDISIAVTAFGSYPNHPRWNPNADINQDNKIDIKDIYLTAKNFRKQA